MPSDAIDYRNPRTTTAAGHHRLLVLIRRREHFSIAKMILAAVAGVGLSFIVPLLAASIAYGIFEKSGVDLPFAICLWAAIVVIAPLLYWLEWRTRGDFAMDTLGQEFHGPASSYGEWRARGVLLTGVFWTELALIGPRLLLGAWRENHRRRPFRHVDRGRACDILHILLNRDDGIETAALIHPHEPPADFRLTLRYLQHHLWIDLSRPGDRAWLPSEARRALNPR